MKPVDERILAGLAARIPGTPAVVAAFESACPDQGVGRALAAAPARADARRPLDLGRLLNRPADPDVDETIPERLPPLGLFAAHPEGNPIAWAPAPAPALPVLRSRADARWIRVADDACAGVLDGDVRVDVDPDGRAWLFCEPSTRAALRLHGGWVLVTLGGDAWLCREAPASALPAPDPSTWGAALDPLVEEEAEGVLDHVGLLLRFGRPSDTVAARVRAGEAPPHVPAIRAWARTVPADAWAAEARTAADRAGVLLAGLPSADDPHAVGLACVRRDVLESAWAVLTQVGCGDALLALLDRVDAEAEARGLADVEIDPVPVRLQHEAGAFARWWGRP